MGISNARQVDITSLKHKTGMILNTGGYHGIGNPISYAKFCELFSERFPEHKDDLSILWDIVSCLVQERVISYRQGTGLERNDTEFFLN